MNKIQQIKIARNIIALKSSDLRRLQNKYDDEYDIFDETVEVFEELLEMIEEDESIEKDRGFWSQLFKDYDPEQIAELIVTHIASGLFIRVFKMMNELINAAENLDKLKDRINEEDLHNLSKKELLSFLKEIRKERRFLAKSDSVIPNVEKLIDEMIKRAENLKSNKDLKDIAKNDTIKSSVADIISALESAKEDISGHEISGDIQAIVDELKNGEKEIQTILKEGSYNQQGKEKNTEESKDKSKFNGNIDDKLDAINGNTTLKFLDILETQLNPIATEAQINDGIVQNLIRKIDSNILRLISEKKSDKPDQDQVLSFIQDALWKKDNNLSDYIFNEVYNNQLANNLKNAFFSNFYTNLQNTKIVESLIRIKEDLLKILTYDFEDNDRKEVDVVLTKAFNDYNKYFINVLKNIKDKFEEEVDKINPEALRITRTSSINKIAKRIVESYK